MGRFLIAPVQHDQQRGALTVFFFFKCFEPSSPPEGDITDGDVMQPVSKGKFSLQKS